MHLIAWTISALALLHSSQAVTTLSFNNNNRVWAGGILKAICSSDTVTTTTNILSFVFSKAGTAVLDGSRGADCTVSTTFTPTGTLKSRTTLVNSNTAAIEVDWSSMAAGDAGDYTCSLTPCVGSAVVSATVILTVATPPSNTAPTIANTQNSFKVYENTQTVIPATCTADPGVGGRVVMGQNISNVIFQDVTNYASPTTAVSRDYALKLNRMSQASITCEAVNNVGTDVRTSGVVNQPITVEYSPSGNVFTSNKPTEYPITATTTAGQYVINAKAPLDIIVTCQPDSIPTITTGIALNTLSAPAGIVQTVPSSTNKAQILFSNTQHGAVALQCNATYKSSVSIPAIGTGGAIGAPGVVTTQISSTLTINVTSGASLAKFSVAAYLATLLVLLKAFQ